MTATIITSIKKLDALATNKTMLRRADRIHDALHDHYQWHLSRIGEDLIAKFGGNTGIPARFFKHCILEYIRETPSLSRTPKYQAKRVYEKIISLRKSELEFEKC